MKERERRDEDKKKKEKKTMLDEGKGCEERETKEG